MKVGYCRVSTERQDYALQVDALKRNGCVKIYEDKASGQMEDRTGLVEAMSFIRSGDVLVVWKLDRLGRSLSQLIQRVKQLEQRGVGLISLTEAIDTTSPSGKLIFHVFGALAEWELSMIRQRTIAGLEAARARGRIGGRPSKFNSEKVIQAKQLLVTSSASKVAQLLGVSRATLYRHVRQ